MRVLDCPQPKRPAWLWILTHADIRNSARVKAFMEFVGTELAKLRPSFEGQPQA